MGKRQMKKETEQKEVILKAVDDSEIAEPEEKTELEKIEDEIKEFRESEVEEESIRMQKAKWVQEQVEKQREIEDATRERIEQEQELLDEMKRSTQEHLERTKELRKFNEDTRNQMRLQVFELNGLTEDKLQGMKEYKNAYYQGIALAFFILSVALVGICGYLHGFDSQICLFMIAFSGVEGALLSQESKRGKLMTLICRLLYMLLFPVMLVMFICYELHFSEYEIWLPYVVIAGCGILVFGTIDYFVYNPYRKDKRKLRGVKEDLKEIEDEAEKAVRRNQRRRKRQETRLIKKLRREQRRAEVRLEKDAKRQERMKKQEDAKLVQKQKIEKYKLLVQNKKDAMIAKLDKKSEIEATASKEEIVDAEIENAEIEDVNADNETK